MTDERRVRELEIWKPFPLDERYQASNLGRVKNIDGSIKAQQVTMHGYYRVCISKNDRNYTIQVHRMVMAAFHGDSDLEVDHIDNNRLNNNLNNLRYATPSENCMYKRNHGTDNRGEKHPQAKLTPEQVLAIRSEFLLFGKKRSNRKELGKKYNVSADAIGLVVKRKTWLHI